jgi:hypothetical protein
MSHNPIDAFLYGVANSGNDSFLVQINPATAEPSSLSAKQLCQPESGDQ